MQINKVEDAINCLKKMWGGEIFVPKIPSYKILTLAKAIGEKSKIKIANVIDDYFLRKKDNKKFKKKPRRNKI